jgi:hypothetical protein
LARNNADLATLQALLPQALSGASDASIQRLIEGVNRSDFTSAVLNLRASTPSFNDLPTSALAAIADQLDGPSLKALNGVNKNTRDAVGQAVRSLEVNQLSDLPQMVKRFPNVAKIDLSDALESLEVNFHGGVLQALAGLGGLKEVKLPLFDGVLDPAKLADEVAKVKGLERLKTTYNPGWDDFAENYSVTDDLLNRLSPLVELKELPPMRLYTDAGVENLLKFPNLKTIDLFLPRANSNQIEGLGKLLPRLDEGGVMTINCRNLNKDDLNMLAREIQQSSGLGFHLDLTGIRDIPEDVWATFATNAGLDLKVHIRAYGVRSYGPPN